jgi:hypothetical protein
MNKHRYYRVFTHDLRSPIQTSEPVWDGSLPHRLPVVKVDDGPKQCAPGWHACRDAEDALQISGLWHGGKNGGPARIYRVARPYKLVDRGQKVRAAAWTIVEEMGPPNTKEINCVLEVWGELVRAHRENRKADLRGAYLGGADLRNANLRGAYLDGAYLGGANLGDANLRDADLGGAYLGDAYLGDADLGGAYLGGVYLGGAYLRGAYLGDADLGGAYLGSWERGPDGYARRIS